MPYIKLQRKLTVNLNNMETSGELNYILTTTCQAYIKKYTKDKGMSYAALNDIVGALECCKQEFIRRVVNPYEDTKIKENGDVY